MASGRIVIPNYMPALDLNGDPVAGAKIYFFLNETTTLQSVYADDTLTVALTNPVVADSAGAFPSIFADLTAAYTVAIRDASDVPIGGLRDVDNVQAAESQNLKVNLTGDNIADPVTFKDNAEIIGFKPGPDAITGVAFGADQIWQNDPSVPNSLNALYQGGQWTAKIKAGAVFSTTFEASDHSGAEAPLPALLSVGFSGGGGYNADICGIQAMGIATVTGDTAFAANFIAATAWGVENCKLVGLEIDTQHSGHLGAGNGIAGDGSSGLYINNFNANDAGDACQVNSHGGYYANAFKVGKINPNIGAALSSTTDGEMGSLVNTGIGAFGQAGIVLGNGSARGMRLYGPNSTFGRLFVDGSGYTHLCLADQSFIVRDSTDVDTLLQVAQTGVGIGKNSDVSTGAKLHVAADFALDAVDLVRLVSSDGFSAIEGYTARGTAGNAAATTLRLRANSTTGRALNAGGTVNASGADYAEYERKCDSLIDAGREIVKGDVIGFTMDGRVTDRWAQAISFGVKSTRPALTGGDEVFDGLPDAPSRPPFARPEYTGLPFPGDTPPPPAPSAARAEAKATLERRAAALVDTVPTLGALRGLLLADAEWLSARAVIQAEDAAMDAERARLRQEWTAQHEQWVADKALHKAAVEAAEAEYEAVTLPAWQAAYDAWLALMDAARAPFDRIAYAGKVPVNVTGATQGQYLVPAEGPNGTITATAVDAVDLTLAQSLVRLGRVRRLLDDGRPEIVVHVG